MRKLTYEHVKEYIEKEGYILLSDGYENNHTKLKVRCPEGHEYKVIWGSFQRGQRCAECFGKKKLTYKYVKEQIENEGYKLLSKTYKNANTKLKVLCPEGHEYEVVWGSFQQGHRCTECSDSKKLTHEYIKEQFEKEGYQLLSKEYINALSKLKIKCPKGHEYKATWNNFQSGNRCAKCSGKKKLTYEHVKEQIEKEGHILLSKEYKNNHSNLKVRCKEGHKHNVSWNNFQQGKRCPVCFAESSSSKAENEIFDYTKIIYNGEIISNDRTQIINPLTGHNLELDIWLPELNKAIEFNGKYWHSLYNAKRKDKIKQQQCEEKGIDLIVVHEENWIANKEQCLNKIQEFIKEN